MVSPHNASPVFERVATSLKQQNTQGNWVRRNEFVRTQRAGYGTPVHPFVRIAFSLRFCHALYSSTFVRHLSHAQLHPTSTFVQLSGYDTSRPMARPLNVRCQDAMHCGFKSSRVQRPPWDLRFICVHPCSSVDNSAISLSRDLRSATSRSQHD